MSAVSSLWPENQSVDHDEHSHCQCNTDNQHGQRRSIEKARTRLNRCLDDMSAFIVHKLAYGWTRYCNEWLEKGSRAQKFSDP